MNFIKPKFNKDGLGHEQKSGVKKPVPRITISDHGSEDSSVTNSSMDYSEVEKDHLTTIYEEYECSSP
jgi:hypothetical protein